MSLTDQIEDVGMYLGIFLLGCVVAFFAMNFNGAIAFLGQFGQWALAQVMNIWSLGFSGLYWIFQALTAFFANIIVGAFNAVVGALNSRLGALGVDIPMWGYITSPTVNATFQEILADMGYQNQQVTLVGQQYLQTVTSQPIQSAAIGLGTGGATLVTAATQLAESDGGLDALGPTESVEPAKKKSRSKTTYNKESVKKMEAYEKTNKNEGTTKLSRTGKAYKEERE